jgi:hypothetical protein
VKASQRLCGRTLQALCSTLRHSAFCLLFSAFCFSGSAQTLPLSLDQNAFLYKTYPVYTSNTTPTINWQSRRGVPISTNSLDAGSDGRAPTLAQQISFGTNYPTANPSPGQFRGFVGIAAVAVQHGTNLTPKATFAQNVVGLNWPRLESPPRQVVAILRAAQGGASYLLAISVIPPGVAPEITFIGFTGNSPILQFSTAAGRSYSVLGSPNLRNWSRVAFNLSTDAQGAPTRASYAATGNSTIQVYLASSPLGETAQFFRILVQ